MAAALSGLLVARQTPAGPQQAASLLAALRQHAGDPAIATPALLLLARWAAAQQGAAAASWEAQSALKEAAQLALGLLSAGGVQAEPGPAAARLLGAAARGECALFSRSL